jgi:hypothetical protein
MVETRPCFEQNPLGCGTLEQGSASLNILVTTSKHKWHAMQPQKSSLA